LEKCRRRAISISDRVYQFECLDRRKAFRARPQKTKLNNFIMSYILPHMRHNTRLNYHEYCVRIIRKMLLLKTTSYFTKRFLIFCSTVLIRSYCTSKQHSSDYRFFGNGDSCTCMSLWNKSRMNTVWYTAHVSYTMKDNNIQMKWWHNNNNNKQIE